jgi:predicted protein tyrosine phosphatase
MTTEATAAGWSRLDDRVLLADAGQAMAMAGAGASRLIDLRAETTPPRLPVPIEHFPVEDLEPGQEEAILAAARRARQLAGQGVTVGIYCQAGVSRTAAVAIAYLLLGGAPLAAARDEVRRVRPQAMPAIELWHALEHLAAGIAAGEIDPEP